MNDLQRIYEQWHEFAKSRDVSSLIDLYAENASFESPLVPAILGIENGVLHGRSEILRFLEEGTKRRPNELVRWYRTGQYFTNNDTLVWEYPREAPDGNQIDILELMQVARKKITSHRIYWGWFGCQQLVQSAVAKVAKSG